MARPPEIDGKLVVRLRSLKIPVPWESIAMAMGVSRSGVIQAYRRESGLASQAGGRAVCHRCNSNMICSNEECDAA